MKPLLFIDMDEVIVNYYEQYAKYVKAMTGVCFKYKLENLKDYSGVFWLKEYFSEEESRQINQEIFDNMRFWTTMPAISNAIETMEKLNNEYNIYISTSAFASNSDSCILGKKEWVKKYLPFIDLAKLIYCHHKHLLCGDYIIDDLPHAIVGFTGKIIIMDYPYNRFFEADYRAKNWKEIGDILL